ncbi:hypothetical protein [Streptomyces roseoviridis]|uniref:hypothetical protein n=1 Tax=Streptomyces roseoviridis TaxID=67361 RepID=UPI0031E63917
MLLEIDRRTGDAHDLVTKLRRYGEVAAGDVLFRIGILPSREEAGRAKYLVRRVIRAVSRVRPE